MKLILTALLAGALIALPYEAQPQNAPAPDPKCSLVKACAIMFIVGIGVIILQAGCRKCNTIVSNIEWQSTNTVEELIALPPMQAGADCDQPMTIQSASGIGSAWVDEYRLTAQQVGGAVVGVVYRGSAAIATNVCNVTSNGVAVLDFSRLPTPPSYSGRRIFRIAQ